MELIPVVVALVVLFLIVKFFSLSFSLLWNGVIGAVMLWVLNLAGGMLNFHLPITIITALIAGIFGVPGVIVLVIYYLVVK